MEGTTANATFVTFFAFVTLLVYPTILGIQIFFPTLTLIMLFMKSHQVRINIIYTVAIRPNADFLRFTQIFIKIFTMLQIAATRIY